MSTKLTLAKLQEAAAGRAAAFRCRRKLQPAAGPGGKIFPPTFAGATYSTELRRLPGREQPAPCVVVDTVQSQANRMEEALQQALDAGRINIPVVEVDFTPFVGEPDAAGKVVDGKMPYAIGKVTSLQAPHRLADAILRDSQHGGVSFRKSDVGKTIDAASFANATPLYELGPTTLVFGMWDSTGPRGGLGAKFERAIVSEIVGIDCPYLHDGSEGFLPRRMGVRRDPLNVSSSALVREMDDTTWENVETGSKKDAKGAIAPSKINHGNVPFGKKSGGVANSKDDFNAGITVDHCEHTTTLSLIALRRLRFPAVGQAPTKDRDDAARTVLAALGLCAAALAADEGLDLRSRCLLWPDGPMVWELLDKPGDTPTQYELGAEAAVALLAEAVAAAKKAGVTWRDEPVKLVPSPQLVKLVARSQALEAKNQGEEAGDGD